MSSIARAAGRLIPGRDLHIIGCRRPATIAGPSPCLGVRWAAKFDLGMPISGYKVLRRPLPQGELVELGTYCLPNTTGWPQFLADAKKRKPKCGPYFDEINKSDFIELLPIIRLCDPRTDASEMAGLIERAAHFFGETHRSDEALAFQYWRFSAVPPLAQLLTHPLVGPAVEQHYRRQSLALLQLLALRFEYAALFGLAIDDSEAGDGDVAYQVRANFGGVQGMADSDAVIAGSECQPPPPAWVTAERAPGGVIHSIASLFPNWRPPAGLAAMDGDGQSLPPSATWPRVPAALTALAWEEAPPEPKLIGHGPVLYRVSRFDHGPDTAAQMSPPALPTGAIFEQLGDGEDHIRGRNPPHYIDTPNMEWPPLAGHYTYDVKGVDLLGVASLNGSRATVRHHDDLPPPSPRVERVGEPIISLENDNLVDVPLRIIWESPEEFGGPDVVEFRVASSFRPLQPLALDIISASVSGPLHIDLVVASLPIAANALAGCILSLADADYPIVSNGAGVNAPLRIRRPAGRMIATPVTGQTLAPGPVTPVTRVARMMRKPMVPVSVTTIFSVEPLELKVASADSEPIPNDEHVSLYLHLLNATLRARRMSAGRYQLELPEAETPAGARWQQLVAMLPTDAGLKNSPAILFPHHDLDVRAPIPTGAAAGSLMLHVTAADGADYVASPVQPVYDPSLANARGNESARATVTLAVRRLMPPGDVVVGPHDPTRRIWAKSAANYAEEASYELSWPAAAGAARYEVWRILEGGIAGASKATPDGELRQLAADSDNFQLRGDKVFGTSYVDGIIGRAPVRALYKVRAVSVAGITGGFSEIIGPVYVPDVRQPPPPMLMKAAPMLPGVAERSILLEWVAPTAPDIRFDIWCASAAEPNTSRECVHTAPAGSSPDTDGRFRFIHGDRVPGKLFNYEVVAVREALDPIDPTAVARRDIVSASSLTLSAAALASGPLLPPANGAAEATGTGVKLTWQLADHYDAIEVRRRSQGRFAFVLVERLEGTATTFHDSTPQLGSVTYRIRGIAASRLADSPEITVELV